MLNNVTAYQPSVISQISHELRIPITGIVGMAHFLEETPLNSEQQSYLQVILASANRLLSLENKLYALLKGNQNNAQ